MMESEKIFMCDRVFYILSELVLGAAFTIIAFVVVVFAIANWGAEV